MTKRSDKTQTRPCSFVIHGLEHARTACLVARELDVPIELHSAPFAAASLGAHWFDKILAEIDAEFPDLHMDAVFDCGDSAGLALAALRQGIRRIRFSGPRAATDKIRDIAGQQGAHVDTIWPDVLDLAHEPDPSAACRDRFAGRLNRG